MGKKKECGAMSKKNKLSTRKNQHAFNVEREKQLAKERKEKSEKRKEKLKRKKLTGVVVKRKNKRGIKLRKISVVKGVKIKNAASKQKARRLLMAEAALKVQVDRKLGPFPCLVTAIIITLSMY